MTARRGVATGIAALVVLVGLSVAWDAVAPEPVPDTEPSEDDGTGPERDDRPDHAPVPLSHTADPGWVPPALVGRWLVVSQTTTGRFLQVDPSTGEVLEIAQVPAVPEGVARPRLIAGHLVTEHGVHSLRDGRSTVGNGLGLGVDRVPDRWDRVIGVTTDDTVIVSRRTDRGVLHGEVEVDGTLIGEHTGHELGSQPRWGTFVVGRRILESTLHGVLTTELDTGRTWRLSAGSVLAAGGGAAILRTCDDTLACSDAIIDTVTGAHRAELGQLVELGVDRGSWTGTNAAAVFASDGTRLVLVGERAIDLVDTETGEVLAHVQSRASERAGANRTTVLWADDASGFLVMSAVVAGPVADIGLREVFWVDRDGEEITVLDELRDRLVDQVGRFRVALVGISDEPLVSDREPPR